ncbi:MAG TPA: cupredoxin domain-containing protein [Gemmatimonadales bacterium]|jgi:plastocyanin domain-containing protein|nr:cupredoxin domain-containing protein [Gemmatimonadales bacterium]
MGSDKWTVLLGGIAAIAWVLWYFFLARRSAARATAAASGTQEITVTVRGGYDPAEIEVEAGRPVRLWFDRQETSGCSEEVVFPDFKLRRFLPPQQKTAVEFTPQKAGEHEFTCGMGMLRGKLIVR